MPVVTMFLVVLALVLFFLATIGIPNPPRFSFVAAGLFCLTLAYLFGAVPLLSR